jgi:hypothetical protein
VAARRRPSKLLFLIGVFAFAWFMAGLWRGWSYEAASEPSRARKLEPARVPLS